MEKFRSRVDFNSNTLLRSFVAGSLSGTCSTIILQPLDLIKTRIQRQAGIAAKTTEISTSMFGMTRHVLATENVLGLWKGIMPSITRTVPGLGIQFGSIHLLKTNFNIDNTNPIHNLTLGITARCVAGTIMIPITVVKTRYESGCFGYSRISSALVSIYKAEGIRGLCCGLIPTLVRDAPYSGFYYMFYTQLKRKVSILLENHGSSENQPIISTDAVNFVCGITAGFAASAVTHPADVIKTRMQIYTQRNSIINVTYVIMKEGGGIRALFVGMAPRILRKSLMSALTWTVYEKFMRSVGLNK